MNERTAREAIGAAERFVELAKAALIESDRQWAAHKEYLKSVGVDWPEKYWHGGKHAAAAKRASMDLTRALAEMRRAR